MKLGPHGNVAGPRMAGLRNVIKSFLGLSECRVPGVWAPPAQYCLGTMGPFVRTARWAVSPHVSPHCICARWEHAQVKARGSKLLRTVRTVKYNQHGMSRNCGP